tara:strand:+ start:326 stop:1027 length:702 start_codon:yes stop_codon:yes gene_type:complete
MCNPAAAVAGGQMAVGLLGTYLAYQQQKQATEEANRQKDIRDGFLKEKLLFEYGMGAQNVADINKQMQQVEDIESQSSQQAELDAIRAEGKMNVAELAEGQSTELLKGQMVRESLNVQDTIKENAGIDKVNLNYQLRDVATGLNLRRMDTINAINSTSYQSAPNQALFMLQGLGSVASSAQTYYSMPDSSKQSWFSNNNTTPSKSTTISKGYGGGKQRRTSGMQSYYSGYNVG